MAGSTDVTAHQAPRARPRTGSTTRTDPSRTERPCPTCKGHGNPARVGRPIPFRARSAQGPVHFPPTWRVMMRRCHPGQPGQGRRARAESGGLGGGKGGRRARIFFCFVGRSLVGRSLGGRSLGGRSLIRLIINCTVKPHITVHGPLNVDVCGDWVVVG